MLLITVMVEPVLTPRGTAKVALSDTIVLAFELYDMALAPFIKLFSEIFIITKYPVGLFVIKTACGSVGCKLKSFPDKLIDLPYDPPQSIVTIPDLPGYIPPNIFPEIIAEFVVGAISKVDRDMTF
jgi:hypothetical protein